MPSVSNLKSGLMRILPTRTNAKVSVQLLRNGQVIAGTYRTVPETEPGKYIVDYPFLLASKTMDGALTHELLIHVVTADYNADYKLPI
jgi:hypothetical protein